MIHIEGRTGGGSGSADFGQRTTPAWKAAASEYRRSRIDCRPGPAPLLARRYKEDPGADPCEPLHDGADLLMGAVGEGFPPSPEETLTSGLTCVRGGPI